MPEATLEKNKEQAMTQTPCREEVFFPPEYSPIVPSSGAVTLMKAQQHQSFCNYPHPTHFPSFLPSVARLPGSRSHLSAPPLANLQVTRIAHSPSPLGMYRTAQYDRTMPVVCHARPRRIERALPPDAPTSGSVLSYPPLGIPVCYAWRACM